VHSTRINRRQDSHSITENPVRPLVLLSILSYAGFVLATILTVTHLHGSVIGCPVGGGCSTVLNGRYSLLAGIPVSLLGSLYYGGFFIATTAAFADWQVAQRYLWPLSAIGFAVSLLLFGMQLFVLNSLCMYCLLSGAVATTIFLIAFTQFRKQHPV
jgi:uncharacterized membrane protein